MVKPNCKMLKELLVSQKFDVTRPTDKGIKGRFVDAKDNIETCNLTCLNRTQQTIDHFTYYFPLRSTFQLSRKS